MTAPTIVEINIDDLVGPTHHYSGMGVGNIASIQHRHDASSPKQAALEGLRKAWLLAQTGVPQFLLPPPMRPRLDVLADYGFRGSLGQQLSSAWAEDRQLLSAVSSSSFMWAANAATVTAPSDSHDGKLHVTIANLISSLHRSIEAEERYRQLNSLFGNLGEQVVIHPPLPASVALRDEGAANQMRLSHPGRPAGVNVFVHGDSFADELTATRFLARHTLAASRMISRLHQLDGGNTIYLQQHPEAISAGAFHNDVVATSHQNLLIHHEKAFAEHSAEQVGELAKVCQATLGCPLHRIVVSECELSLDDSVRSYLFNSQIVSPSQASYRSRSTCNQWASETSVASSQKMTGQRIKDQSEEFDYAAAFEGLPRMLMIAPQQCCEVESAKHLIDRWITDPDIPIDEVRYVELRQSMAGGGGPACLRLRVPIWQHQVSQLLPTCRLDKPLYGQVEEVIDRLYPERLEAKDLAQPGLAEQAWQAAAAVARTLGFACE